LAGHLSVDRLVKVIAVWTAIGACLVAFAYIQTIRALGEL
jgi:hypothetical protein